jgi:hypothetical protein
VTEGTFTVEVPMPVPSRANQHTGWQVRWTLVRRQHEAMRMAFLGYGPTLRKMSPSPPRFTIQMVRVANRLLDSDNVEKATKAARDFVSKWLGFRDDSHPALRWMKVQQEKTKKVGYQAVRVTIAPGHSDCAHCGQMVMP